MDTLVRSMCVDGTPVEDYRDTLGLWAKREDMSCPGGPNFSKTRGVFAHVAARPERVIGVLDTSHSQGGWAVARACQLLGKRCVLYYPEFKKPRPAQPQQLNAQGLGAELIGLPAGRSAVLYHRAKKDLHERLDSYMMPNALKLPEMVSETAAEVERTALPDVGTVIISASSGTIAAGVCLGLHRLDWEGEVIIHQGYSRPQGAMRAYMEKMVGPQIRPTRVRWTIVDEGYDYADRARPGPTPPFPCNDFYDLKAFRWWMRDGSRHIQPLLWNVG